LTGTTLTSPQVLTVNYYDTYGFLTLPEWNSASYGFRNGGTGYDANYLQTPRGLPTGTLTGKLDGSSTVTYLTSVFYYDNRQRVIQSHSSNHLGGFDTEYTAYNFPGNPTSRKVVNTHAGTTTTEVYTYSYDHLGRLTETKHQINGGANTTLAKNQYDELGRLKTVYRGGASNLPTTYSYNVRSWVTGINALQTVGGTPLFSQTLTYNTGSKPMYNGNISAIGWTNPGATSGNYTFAYDDLSRLTAAVYK